MTKKLIALLLALAIFSPAFADMFIVTSNADSGPGTLREAITLAGANGSVAKDEILFDLPDLTKTGRRITLLAELPALSSNMVINASTQPGDKFGLSDAKVELFFDYAIGTEQSVIKILNCNDVSIYALKFNDNITWTAWYKETICIRVENSNNIEIGAVGKGNVFVGWIHMIKGRGGGGANELKFNKNIRIYSNFFGLTEDGVTVPAFTLGGDAMVFEKIENIEVGNLDPASGNVIAASRKRIQIAGTKGKILIAHNKIGTDYTGTTMLSLPYGESDHLFDNIAVTNSPWTWEIEYQTDVKIINNLSTGYCGAAVKLVGIGKKFYIQGNKIGTDIMGTKRLSPKMDYGIYIANCSSGIIGVENDETTEKNTIAYSEIGSSGTGGSGGWGVSVYQCLTGITISRNSIFCNQNTGIRQIGGWGSTVPEVTINQITPTTISGTAPPLSRIELFRDDECVNCEGKTYFDETYADDKGNWTKANINTENIVVTATDKDKMTSEFSMAKYVYSSFRVKDASCGRNNGAIEGIKITSGTWWQWEDINGVVVSRDSVLKNAAPGKYRLVVGIGRNACTLVTQFHEIKNRSLPAAITPVMTPASCGLNNGRLQVTYDETVFTGNWLNSVGDSVGTGTRLNNCLPGSYYLKLAVQFDTTCNTLFGPFVVTNQSGPSLNTQTIKIKPSVCGGSQGSVTGIIAENGNGSFFIQWVDSLDKTVGNSFDLVNVPAGKYRLKFKDASACDTIVSYHVIPNLGSIVIDTAGKIILPAKCTGAGGYIQALRVSGADAYRWVDLDKNSVVATTLRLDNVPSGRYQLTATNGYGCMQTAPVMVVSQAAFQSIAVASHTTKDAICGEINGSVSITSFTANASSYTFRWVDSSSQQLLGTGLTLQQLDQGTYQLWAKDANQCEGLVYTSHISKRLAPRFDYAALKLNNDHCELKQGSITSVQVNGLMGAATYTWYNASNQVVGREKELQHVPAGVYTLKVADEQICKVESKPLTLSNENTVLPDVAYESLIIPRFTSASLAPKLAAEGVYTLYASRVGGTVLQQSNTGGFVVPGIISDTTFYVRRTTGACSSALISVTIKVIDQSYFAIPTAFTPNGDGRNDKLTVDVIGYIKLKRFRVFNRYGAVVFETQALKSGWDGVCHNVLQPAGVYVWIAQGEDINGKSITGKGSFMLIR